MHSDSNFYIYYLKKMYTGIQHKMPGLSNYSKWWVSNVNVFWYFMYKTYWTDDLARTSNFSNRMATVAIYFWKQFITLAQIALLCVGTLTCQRLRAYCVFVLFFLRQHISFIKIRKHRDIRSIYTRMDSDNCVEHIPCCMHVILRILNFNFVWKISRFWYWKQFYAYF